MINRNGARIKPLGQTPSDVKRRSWGHAHEFAEGVGLFGRQRVQHMTTIGVPPDNCHSVVISVGDEALSDAEMSDLAERLLSLHLGQQQCAYSSVVTPCRLKMSM
jgi:hypothetical protein